MNFHKKALKFKYIIAIIISLIITFLIVGGIVKNNFFKVSSSYVAEKGVLNLQDWNPDEKEEITLDGEWEFYPQALLDPSKDKVENNKAKDYIKVPGSFKANGYSNGSGTYRLVIKVPQDRVYGIKTRTIRSSNRIYLNGKEVANVGNPSLDISNFKPGSKYKVAVGNSLENEIELIIHVSSYEYRTVGIFKSIEFGTFESIINQNNKDRVIDAFIISVCLTLGLYFFVTYIQRRKEKYFGYFSGVCLFMGLYLSTMNEQLLDLIYNYSFATRTRIQIFTMVMVMISILKFTYHFFYSYINKKSMNIVIKIMTIIVLLVFNNPEKPLSIPLSYVQTLLLSSIILSYGYISGVLLKAIYHKVDSLEYIIVITNAMFLYWISMACKIFLEICLGYTSVILIFVIMISVALLMNRRFQLDYEELNILSEKLILHDRSKDEFLAKASNELRTPLQIVLNLTNSLLEGGKGELNSNQQENLFLIHQEGERLLRLVEDFLDASQVKKGEIKLRMSSVDIYNVVESILKEMKFLIPKSKQIILKNNISKNFPILESDTDKIRQIIYNLVHNSIKYTESGEMVISAYLENEQAVIKVTDTGIGIEEKYLNEIFDTFYQINENDKSNQGLGLGLPIVEQLVKSIEGEVSVESTYGEGSSFKITLPLCKGIIKEQDKVVTFNSNALSEFCFKEEKDMKYSINNQTVLIVDNHPLNRSFLVSEIEQMGLNTTLAYNGMETLEVIDKVKVDLIILDFMLPDMSGDKVCKEIRRKYSMSELPIMILAASGKTIDLMNAFDYGANDFQKQTSDVEELKKRINSLLLMKKSVEDGLKKEFQYFYSQISPHFLYNTSNTIIGLSYKDNEKTREALNNLSTYLRGKLDVHQSEPLISLESELELLIAYLEIERLRFGERLNVEYDIEERLRAMIPPLTLQPLVENAVHYGMETKDNCINIKICVNEENIDFIKITIEDNGIGITSEKQEELLSGNNQRIGFTNVLKKIKILKDADLKLESEVGKYTKITIIIPKLKPHDNYYDLY